MKESVEAVGQQNDGWVTFITPEGPTSWAWSRVNLQTGACELIKLPDDVSQSEQMWKQALALFQKSFFLHGAGLQCIFEWLDPARFARVVVDDPGEMPTVSAPEDRYWCWDARNVPQWVRMETHPNVNHILDWSNDTGLEQGTEKWKVAHDKMLVSGSILNDIVGKGYKGYGARRGIVGFQRQILAKTNNDPEPFSGNTATAHGHRWEGTALEMTAHDLQAHVFEVGLVTRDICGEEFAGFVGGSADGITSDNMILEVKCPYMRKIKPGTFPSYYSLQPQFYMRLMDIPHAKFVQFRPSDLFPYDHVEFDITDVPYDAPAMEEALEKSKEFMREVLRIRRQGTLNPATYDYMMDRKRCRYMDESLSVANRTYAHVDPWNDEPEHGVSLPEFDTVVENHDVWKVVDLDILYTKANVTINQHAETEFLQLISDM